MANHKSAIKRIRQTKTRTERNKSLRSRMKTKIRALQSAAKNKDKNLDDSFKEVASVISASASKGALPKRTASRKISRLAKLVNKSK